MVHRSLHIGINYTGSQNQLAGCINDARDWHGLFSSICAESAQLLEQSATKAGIVSAISSVLSKLGAGDTAIITFSGHGTYIPDRNRDEADGRDEALCPFDLTRNLLLDDELRDLLSQRVAGSRVLLITDCCHSGTMMRAPAAIVVDSPIPAGVPRYVPFADLTTCMCADAVDRITTQAKAARTRAAIDDPGLVHWSGCKDTEVSYDATIGGRSCGVFSNAALKVLAQHHGKFLKHDTVAALVQAVLPNQRFPQSPQFNGDLSLYVPGFEPMPLVGPNPLPLPSQVFRGTLDDGRKFNLEIGG
jgi:hypothetical protein